MAKYKDSDYAQTMMVAVSLVDQLQPRTLEHTIHYVMEKRLDLSGFDQQRCNDETGRPGHDAQSRPNRLQPASTVNGDSNRGTSSQHRQNLDSNPFSDSLVVRQEYDSSDLR